MNILDILCVVLIFAIIAYVGYTSSKKVKTMDDFTLAGSKLGKIQAGFSMAATEFGGSSLVGAMAFCYTVGIAGAWWDWSAVPALIILGVFFAGKIKLPQMVTITDFFEKRYSKTTKRFSSIMHLLAITTQLSTQFMVGAVALNGILGVPKNIGLIISVVFVMVYTIGGGLIAVVNTDVVQFVIIVLSILVALPIALWQVGGFAGLAASLPQEFFSLGNIEASTVVSWCLLCFFTYSTNQHYLQRVFAAKDKSTARFSFVFTGVSYWVYGGIVSILGMCIAVLLPNLQDPNMGYALLIKNFMPAGIRGLILGGIFAASMSTADSMLLAASTLFVNDIYNPLFSKNNTDEKQLKTIRYVTVVICILSVGISMFMNNIISIMYLGGLFYSTAVFFPLMLGLFWKRATTAGALSSMVVAVVVGLFSEFFLAGKISGFFGLPSNILACLAGLMSIVIVSFLTKAPSEESLSFLSDK